MSVADWLLNCPEHDTDRLSQIFRHYGRTYRCLMGGYGHGFHLWLGDETMGPYNSWGNGAAMRVSAVGWMFDTLEETEHVAELTASVTHNHPEGIKGAQATAAAIFMARTGKSKEENPTIKVCYYEPNENELFFKRTIHGDVRAVGEEFVVVCRRINSVTGNSVMELFNPEELYPVITNKKESTQINP